MSEFDLQRGGGGEVNSGFEVTFVYEQTVF